MVLASGLGFCGCAGFEGARRPTEVGITRQAVEHAGLQVEITPARERIARGESLFFRVRARNVSDQRLHLPRDPELIFTWIYPSGRRDCFVGDFPVERHYQSAELVVLEPGESLELSKSIETHYFPKKGITEFKAIFYVPQNSNRSLNPVWTGRSLSNSYGILLEPPSAKRRRG